MKRVWRTAASMNTCLVLLGLVCCAMAAGSFRLSGEHAQSINTMPLLDWLAAVPAGAAWWLWLTVALLVLLVINTLACSCECIRSRWGRAGLLPLLSSQLVHLGFLLIILAHLQTAIGGSFRQLEAVEGTVAALPDGTRFAVEDIRVSYSPKGYPAAFSARLTAEEGSGAPVRKEVSPNRPWYHGGYGVYLKHADLDPVRWALLEVHREPGAGMALAGALLFTVGNLLVLYLRSKAREFDE